MAAIKQIKVDGVIYDIKAKLDIDGNDITTTYVKKDGVKVLSTEDFTTKLKNKLDGIAEGANNYTHPSNSGNKHIPTGGSPGLILAFASDGTAKWLNTYSAATDSTLGLVKKGAAVGDATSGVSATPENVATLLNALLTSLRAAGIIATE